MPVDITRTLRQALSKLEAEKHRLDRQVAAIRSILGSVDGRAAGRGRRRRRMSAAARRAVSRRMKAYWAARKGGAKGRAKKAS